MKRERAKGKNSIEAAFKRLVITPKVCSMLGKTENQIRDMDMKQFASAVFDKGYEISVDAYEARAGQEGNLTIKADSQSSTDTGSVT
jgi:hypothetical protein